MGFTTETKTVEQTSKYYECDMDGCDVRMSLVGAASLVEVQASRVKEWGKKDPVTTVETASGEKIYPFSVRSPNLHTPEINKDKYKYSARKSLRYPHLQRSRDGALNVVSVNTYNLSEFDAKSSLRHGKCCLLCDDHVDELRRSLHDIVQGDVDPDTMGDPSHVEVRHAPVQASDVDHTPESGHRYDEPDEAEKAADSPSGVPDSWWDRFVSTIDPRK